MYRFGALFWVVSVLASLYYGSRGIAIQCANVADDNFNRTREGREARSSFWRGYVLCVQDFLYNFVCSLAGFIAAGVVWNVSRSANLAEVSAGGGIILAFLVLVAVTGMSGKLPELLHVGRFPAFK